MSGFGVFDAEERKRASQPPSGDAPEYIYDASCPHCRDGSPHHPAPSGDAPYFNPDNEWRLQRGAPSGDAHEMTCGICGHWASNGLHSGDGSGHDFAPSKVFRRRDPAPSGDALREAADRLGLWLVKPNENDVREYTMSDRYWDDVAALATPAPLDVERLARALPDWMVEHPLGLTEDELRRTIAHNIARAYAEQDFNA